MAAPTTAIESKKSVEEKPLIERQARFVQFYLLLGNATQAAIRAGYSAANADKIATQLLGKSRVRHVLEREKAKRAERLGIQTDNILLHQYAIATCDPADYLDITPGGVGLKDIVKLPADVRGAIASITETAGQHGTSISVKFHPKQSAAEFLLKYHGKYQEKQKVSHSGVVSLEALLSGSNAVDVKDVE